MGNKSLESQDKKIDYAVANVVDIIEKATEKRFLEDGSLNIVLHNYGQDRELMRDLSVASSINKEPKAGFSSDVSEEYKISDGNKDITSHKSLRDVTTVSVTLSKGAVEALNNKLNDYGVRIPMFDIALNGKVRQQPKSSVEAVTNYPRREELEQNEGRAKEIDG